MPNTTSFKPFSHHIYFKYHVTYMIGVVPCLNLLTNTK